MKRLAAALAVVAAFAAGCARGEDAAPPPPPPAAEPVAAPSPAAEPVATPPAPAAETGPSDEQLAFRQKLLAEIASGEYKCYCNAELRMRERIEKGLVTDPATRSG
jgi:hypothetical protein